MKIKQFDFAPFPIENIISLIGLFCLLDMPTVAGNFTNYKYEAELGQPIKITLIIDSFQKPDISWTVSAGGKLGYWTVNAKTDHLYSVSTTILPEEESHLGEYEMRIRNDVGTIDVIIELVCKNLNYYGTK